MFPALGWGGKAPSAGAQGCQCPVVQLCCCCLASFGLLALSCELGCVLYIITANSRKLDHKTNNTKQKQKSELSGCAKP